MVELLRPKDAVGMNEPHYSFQNDSQALSVIAENSRKAVLLLEKIHYWVQFLAGGAIVAGAVFIAKKNGWIS